MLRKMWFVLGGVLSVVFLCASAHPGQAASGLVSAKWLQAYLDGKDLRVIDLRADIRDYFRGHIPGAVYLAPDALRLADRGVPGKLMPPEALAIMLGRMGVSRNTRVVAYAEQSDFKAPYLIWALDYLGHPRSAVLEGGFAKWQKEGRPVTQDYPKIRPVQYPVPTKCREEVRASLAEVERVVSRGGAVLLDARPLASYTGEKGPWERKGHIKGAIHRCCVDDLKADGTWKSKAELRQAYQALGATPDKLIIVSCEQGLNSAHSYFTLKHVLGYPRVKNYDGSYSEWSNIEGLPVATGTD